MLNKIIVALLIVVVAGMAYIAYDNYLVEHPAPIAKIVKSKGLVNIRRDIDVITGQKGELLYEGDQLSTNKNSTARVQFTDGSVMVLGAKSSFGFTRYSYNAEAKTLAAQFKSLKGAVRLVTGRTKMSRKVQIRDARGSKLNLINGDVVVANIDDELAAMVIETTADITLSNKQGKQTLSSGLASVIAVRSAPSEPTIWPQDRVAETLALVFEG